MTELQSLTVRTQKQINNWLISYVSQLVGMSPENISTNLPFDAYGIDSTGAAGLSGDLSNWLGCPLDANLIYDHSTIDALSAFVFSTFFEKNSI